ncbi:MAG: uroporphyrinogen decarboxylase family protein [Planctomycetota bacterium]|nr:uroporphyrinogen decarboxylase family protein [Planctomycetota bacterium]
MTGRERFLAAINNEKPDRLPCQVHSWMAYYLKNYLDGADQYAAYARFGMDPVIYCAPEYDFAERDKANWQIETKDLGIDADGVRHWATKITTPAGTLTSREAANECTAWTTKFLIENEADFEIWNKYVPVPTACDWTPVLEDKNRIGETGIVRAYLHEFGQGSPWQSFCTLYDTELAIMASFDKPEWLHHALDSLLEKKLRIIEVSGRFQGDLIETGGGAGSSTVISPALHEEFCLPYDRKQHAALHVQGAKIVYHLCGGLMPLLDLVAQNGADGLETMTPPSMGGDCDLVEATRRVGDKLFFIGGFDQNAGFEKGTPEVVTEMVRELHAACPDGGYICCPSDHFFFGAPTNVQAFVDTAGQCTYREVSMQ